MNHKMYLVHEDHYLRHLEDKIKMYQLFRQLVQTIRAVPSNRGTRLLTEVTNRMESIADRNFNSWNIPREYMVTGNPNWLRQKMACELVSPDAAGLHLRHCDCLYCDDPCCCDAPDTENEDDAEKPVVSCGDAEKSPHEIDLNLEAALEALVTVLGSLLHDSKEDPQK